MPPKDSPQFEKPPERAGPTLPSPLTGSVRRAKQSIEQSAAESLSIEEQMLEKLTSIERMVGLFYRVFWWQCVIAAVVTVLGCAGVLMRK